MFYMDVPDKKNNNWTSKLTAFIPTKTPQHNITKTTNKKDDNFLTSKKTDRQTDEGTDAQTVAGIQQQTEMQQQEWDQWARLQGRCLAVVQAVRFCGTNVGRTGLGNMTPAHSVYIPPFTHQTAVSDYSAIIHASTCIWFSACSRTHVQNWTDDVSCPIQQPIQ